MVVGIPSIQGRNGESPYFLAIRLPDGKSAAMVAPLRTMMVRAISKRATRQAMFKGSITALITPFKNGAVDEAAFKKFVDWQIKEGIDGVVPCGTTGESPTLSHDEHKRVVELCIEVAKGKVPVIAGTG